MKKICILLAFASLSGCNLLPASIANAPPIAMLPVTGDHITNMKRLYDLELAYNTVGNAYLVAVQRGVLVTNDTNDSKEIAKSALGIAKQYLDQARVALDNPDQHLATTILDQVQENLDVAMKLTKGY